MHPRALWPHRWQGRLGCQLQLCQGRNQGQDHGAQDWRGQACVACRALLQESTGVQGDNKIARGGGGVPNPPPPRRLC